MTVDDFDAYFEALTAHRPYRWQRRLFQRWVGGERYDALDLPTGLGKTSVIAVWLLARIAGAKLPRRLIYVVDRRAVVDQATEAANETAARLGPTATGLLAGLRIALGLGGEQTLPVSTLRGQFVDNRLWMDDPAGLAIVVGTVDMIGSRLLFQGYGVSRWMRPVHAGLLGLDTLVVLDEAHLVPPFEAMLRQARRHMVDGGEARLCGLIPGLSPLLRISLSATGDETPDDRVFRLEEEDREDETLALRLSAPKRLMLHETVEAPQLAKALAEQAWARAQAGRRVIIFCHSRITAQTVRELLDKAAKGAFGRKAALTALLVGERRYRERALLYGESTADWPEAKVFDRFRPGRKPDPEGRPAFLVATAAGEVGVDLDADDLVCDLVAWERMVQRFGRVNRRPEPGVAALDVIPAKVTDKGADYDIDPQLALYLKTFDSELWPVEADGFRDASPAALLELKSSPLAPVLAAAQTPRPLRPRLGTAEIEAWSLTSLRDHSGRPNVAPWLRGWLPDQKPESRIAWRRRFPIRGAAGVITHDLRDFLRTAPPHLTEALDAPTYRIVEVLRSRAGAWIKHGGTTGAAREDADETDNQTDDEVAEPQLEAETEPDHPPFVLLLAPDNEIEELYTPERLTGADAKVLERVFRDKTLVVDARLGGLDEFGMLSAGEGSRPDTIDMVEPLAWRLPLEETVGRRIRWRAWIEPTESWRVDDFRWVEKPEQETSFMLWVEVWRGPGGAAGNAAVSRFAQGLQEHHSQAGAFAARIVDDLNIPEPWRTLLIAATESHDLGKARDLWQNAMGAKRDGRPYAKTKGVANPTLLNRYRHEFGSLREVGALPADFLPPEIAKDPDHLDLALHLIAAHHGRARPEIVPFDPDQLPSASKPLAQAAALRFARLQRRWGPWGLAWWEALLRAADWAASRKLNEGEDGAEADAPAAEPQAAHG